MTATPRPQPDTRCLCCGQPSRNGYYLERPCCDDCYRSGKLLECLDEQGNWKDAHHAATMGGCEERYYIRVEVMNAARPPTAGGSGR